MWKWKNNMVKDKLWKNNWLYICVQYKTTCPKHNWRQAESTFPSPCSIMCYSLRLIMSLPQTHDFKEIHFDYQNKNMTWSSSGMVCLRKEQRGTFIVFVRSKLLSPAKSFLCFDYRPPHKYRRYDTRWWKQCVQNLQTKSSAFLSILHQTNLGKFSTHI